MDVAAVFAPYTLDQLTTFLTVLETGSFSAAGRRLGRVQSAVSYAVAQLEEALGTQLFDRSGRSPRPTPAGERLAAEARRVLAHSRALEELAAQLRDDAEPEVVLAVDRLTPWQLLAEAGAAFHDRFPRTSLRIDIGLLDHPVQAVRRGRAAVGVVNLAGTTPPELALHHVTSVRLVPVCAAGHPLAALEAPLPVEALDAHVQVVLSGGESDRDQGVLAARTWRVGDLSLKHALIRSGVGWGSLPEAMAAPELASGTLVALAPAPWPAEGHRLPLHAVHRIDRPLGPAAQWLRERLVAG